jgi:hypothetical protein
MKILKAFENETNTTSVVVKPSTSGEHLEVSVRNDFVLAKVRKEAFDEMLRRGHAAVEPEMSWTAVGVMTGKHTNTCGGRKIFRCDFEVKEGSLWLVPETVENNNLLLFLYWSAWMTDGRTLTAGEDAKILASWEEKFWEKHWDVIVMAPGSTLDFATNHRRLVEGSGPSLRHPFHKEQYAGNITHSKVVFTADGNTLDFVPEYN